MARKPSNKSADSRNSFSTISEGERTHRSIDLLGRVHDWSGAKWTAKGSPKGERGGVHQCYTPFCVVRCRLELLTPDNRRIYDPACGAGSMFVQSKIFGRLDCNESSIALAA